MMLVPVQVTKADRHGIVREAITQMNSATALVEGGRVQQLEVLASKIDWHVKPALQLKHPLLCFVLPPSRYDAQYKSVQRYTAPSKSAATVSQVCFRLDFVLAG